MKVEQGFQQRPFDLGDPWSRDPAFRAVVRRLLAPAPPALSAQHISQRLSAFSLRVATQARPWSHPGRCADPVLVNCDNWGRRIDRLETSEGWRRLTQWSVSNGLIGEAYGPKGQEQYLCRKEYDSAGGREALGGYARLYAFARTYLFAPDSRVNVCPTSMQDGAVRTLELYGTDEQQATYLPRLLSRDVETVWIAGQWMTEKPGGSDVAQTETRATRLESLASASSATTAAPMQPGKPGDLYLLDGFKWFSSCPDGNMALALARTSSSASGAGSAGLSLFLLPLRKSARRPIPAHLQRFVPDNNPHNDYNGIRMHRLKKKLGTELVPTAELELDGAIGELIGHEGRGVFYIASVLNLTRLYSASGTCAAISYALNIATDYAGRRRVNATHDAPRGTLLSEVPMHVERLARVNVTHRALLQLVFGTIALLSLSEARRATPEQDVLLRLLTPIAKAFSALRATECYVQCIEALGGQGYMQESGLGDVLKSATVERVWEGTPSVLSHDVKRVLVKSKGLALVVWLHSARRALNTAAGVTAQERLQTVKQVAQALDKALDAVAFAFLTNSSNNSDDGSPQLTQLVHDGHASRALLEVIGVVQCGIGLLEQAAWSSSSSSSSNSSHSSEHDADDARTDVEVARRWVLGAEGGLPEALRELGDVRERVLASKQDAVLTAQELTKRIVFDGRREAGQQEQEKRQSSDDQLELVTCSADALRRSWAPSVELSTRTRSRL